MKLPTLLLITQNPHIRTQIHRELSAHYFVVEATHANQALLLTQTTRFDFIVLDSNLPDTDPLALVHDLRQTTRTLAPIFFITARLSRAYLNTALSAGVTDFLSDPIDPQELHQQIRTTAETSAARDKTQTLAKHVPRPVSGPAPLKPKFVLPSDVLHLLTSGHAVPILLLSTPVGTEHPTLTLPSGEQLIFLPRHTLTQAQAFADKLKAESIRARTSLSIVVTTLSGAQEHLQSLIESAAKALKQTPMENP